MPVIALTTFFHTNWKKYYPIWETANHSHFTQTMHDAVARCPGIRSISADFRNVVYVPNHFRKYLLRNFSKADVVFVSEHLMPEPGNFDSFADAVAAIQGNGDYNLIGHQNGFWTYLKGSLGCTPENKGTKHG